MYEPSSPEQEEGSKIATPNGPQVKDSAKSLAAVVRAKPAGPVDPFSSLLDHASLTSHQWTRSRK